MTGENGEWLEDRMYGVARDQAPKRHMPPDVPAEAVIAQWMLSMLRKTGGLSQRQAIWGIRELFGTEYLQQTAHGRWTIPRRVLAAFKALEPDEVVWSGRQRAWRPRLPEDPPGRRNVD